MVDRFLVVGVAGVTPSLQGEDDTDIRQQATGHGPLRVLELVDDSAAFAGLLLAQVGAAVTRIEAVSPAPLDQSSAAPAPGTTRGTSVSLPRPWEGTEEEHLHFNAGKDLLRLELPRQAERVHDELRRADVLLTTWRASELASANLAPEQWAKLYPNLVTVTVSPFGSEGPRHHWQATDLVACALGGTMALIGDADGQPLRPPRQQAYHLAGVHGAIGAFLAVLARPSVGRGQQVEVAAVEAVASTLEFGALAYFHQGRRLGRNGSRYSHVPHTILPTADGYVAGGFGGTARIWTGLVQWLVELGQEEDLAEAKWDDAAVRWEAREHLFSVIQRAFETLPTATVASEATRRGLPWAAVLRATEVLDDPQLAWRQFFRPLTDQATGRAVRDAGPAFHLPWLGASPPVPDRHAASSAPTGATVANGGSRAEAQSPSRGASHPSASSTRGTPDARLGALHGLRVLDLTWVLAGPYATKILADHGAEVIKVESVHRPDPTRYAASMRFSPKRDDDDPDTSGYFANFNRNKRSILLNLKHPSARSVALALVANCDVLVENFSAGVLERLGLGPAALHAVRPDLIVLRMSGVGQDGPSASSATFADTLSAMSGMTAETELADGRPRGITFGLGDMVAAGHGVVAALAALWHRQQTGEGCVIDLSQLECVVAQMGSAFVEAANGNTPPVAGRGPNWHPTMAPHGVFRCKEPDSWCAIAAASDEAFRALCAVIGRGDLAADPDLATFSGRLSAHERISLAVEQWTRDREATSVMAMLQEASVAAGVVQDGRDLVDHDEQLRHSCFYQVLEHPKLGPILHEGIAVRLSATPGSLRAPAPLLGADTDDVLTELAGMRPDEIARLRAVGALE